MRFFYIKNKSLRTARVKAHKCFREKNKNLNFFLNIKKPYKNEVWLRPRKNYNIIIQFILIHIIRLNIILSRM